MSYILKGYDDWTNAEKLVISWTDEPFSTTETNGYVWVSCSRKLCLFYFIFNVKFIEQVGSSGNASLFYPGCIWFECWQNTDYMAAVFRGFPRNLQANTAIILQIRPRPLSFLILYNSHSLSSRATQTRLLAVPKQGIMTQQPCNWARHAPFNQCVSSGGQNASPLK